MGTKAVFAIEATKPGWHYKTIIGMTMDGFPDNLEYIATQFEKKMIKLRKKTLVKKGNFEAINKIFESIVSDHEDWLFIDNVNNASWVSHSAIYSPKTGVLKLYNGKLEDLVKETVIRPEPKVVHNSVNEDNQKNI